MSAASFAKPGRRDALWDSFPAKARALFLGLRGRFGVTRDCSWVFVGQSEHLLAYAVWSEIACDDERVGSTDAQGQQ